MNATDDTDLVIHCEHGPVRRHCMACRDATEARLAQENERLKATVKSVLRIVGAYHNDEMELDAALGAITDIVGQ